MQSAIYEGWVRHTRRQPARRSFQYRLFMAYVDLDELEQVFAGLWRKGVKPVAHPQT